MVSILQDIRNGVYQCSGIIPRAQRVDTTTVKIEQLAFCKSSACGTLTNIDKHFTDNYILVICYSMWRD